MPSTAAMGTLADEAAKLLDFNQKLDINLLDNVVTCMYTADGQRVSFRHLKAKALKYESIKKILWKKFKQVE